MKTLILLLSAATVLYAADDKKPTPPQPPPAEAPALPPTIADADKLRIMIIADRFHEAAMNYQQSLSSEQKAILEQIQKLSQEFTQANGELQRICGPKYSFDFKSFNERRLFVCLSK